jgi:hypothetical protein
MEVIMKPLTKTAYTFASDKEPSEKELSALMHHEVAVEAKQRAQQAEQNLLEDIRRAIAVALQREENK